MSYAEAYSKWRHRLIPDHVCGELLTKDWIDNVIPASILVLSVIGFSLLLPGFLAIASVVELIRQMGEITFVTLGMAIMILADGIDLSVGSIFALSNFLTLDFVNLLGWPIPLALPAVVVICALVGLVNGILIGYLRLRAFLTTLATLIIIRAGVDYLLLLYGSDVVASNPDSALWDFLSFGTVLGLPFNYLAALVTAVLLHILLTRIRLGWHIKAIGGSRRSAHNAGIRVRLTVCTTYVLSGLLTGVAGVLYAAWLNNAGTEAGVGLEVVALTAAVLGGNSLGGGRGSIPAAVLGGNSLGGGRGSIPKAVLGAFVVELFINTLLRFGLPSGANPLPSRGARRHRPERRPRRRAERRRRHLVDRHFAERHDDHGRALNPANSHQGSHPTGRHHRRQLYQSPRRTDGPTGRHIGSPRRGPDCAKTSWPCSLPKSPHTADACVAEGRG